MRRFVWVLLLLMAAGWVACQMPFSDTAARSERRLDCWRRTRDGWEIANWVMPEPPTRCPALHPGVVGLLELLVSIAALIAFPAQLGAKSRHKEDASGRDGGVPAPAGVRTRSSPGRGAARAGRGKQARTTQPAQT